MNRIKIVMLTALISASCARQGVIPNTDKFPPHLLSVNSITQTQVNATFDEVLGGDLKLSHSFHITSEDDTVDIKFSAKDDSDNKTIILYTSPLTDDRYLFSGLASDKNNNLTSVSRKFKPSARRDTIPPDIVFSPINAQTTFPYRPRLNLSESADTSYKLTILFAPKINEEYLVEEWNSGLTRYSLAIKDSVMRHRPVYLSYLDGLFDYAGNRTSTPASTYYYSDTTLVLQDARGKITTSSTKDGYSLVLFSDAVDGIFALTTADSSGYFLVPIETRTDMKVEVWFNINGNKVFEEYGFVSVTDLSDTIRIQTSILPEPMEAGEILKARD